MALYTVNTDYNWVEIAKCGDGDLTISWLYDEDNDRH